MSTGKSQIENVIIVDADYVDKVAFNLIVNFERMLERRISKADLACWIDCIALDGGMRPGNSSTQVVLVHDKENSELKNFVPAHYADELEGKAFSDNLGEFVISAPAVEDITTKEQLLTDTLRLFCAEKGVRRIMVVPSEDSYDALRMQLRRLDADEKRITLFSMQPRPGGSFLQEILGFSLLSALGIRSEEITPVN